MLGIATPTLYARSARSRRSLRPRSGGLRPISGHRLAASISCPHDRDQERQPLSEAMNLLLIEPGAAGKSSLAAELAPLFQPTPCRLGSKFSPPDRGYRFFHSRRGLRGGGFHFQVRPAKLFSGLLGNGIRALGTRYDHLTLDERKLIFQLREAKMTVPRIAERLGRHRSTIHREIRRNWHDDGPWLRGYFPEAAQTRTDRRRIRRRKLHQDPDLARHVIARLQQAWSPEQIAGASDVRLTASVGSATRPSISSSTASTGASRTSASCSRADGVVAGEATRASPAA